ncbi:glycosyltransferase family 2 protein [Amycolatopsis endophytica]|uniref:N-acetylglucosaminyl-diphospho-decaprenol L-rhamnosyltransferase n=1 Tax=Amycolatopsis endophytica TaxID=860233 RepID=A0A853AXT5_9PSEU|nr:glycosyltransferase family 2 protein [Amycolatopsis endophytica]NYI87528.1 N-acetylglucosaminyl-diphospho-decaprenol L-rhamnosyltransferase [Amycolatopsis endophytica]
MTEPSRYGDGVAVVVVTYFPGEDLDRFLDSLEKATSRDVQVIVADNDSTDEALDRAEGRAGVQVLRIGENLGYGGGANRGVVELDDRYGWIVIANPDLEWEPGSLDTLLDAGQRWPRGGAFGPLIRDPDGTVYPSARLLPSLGRGMGHAVFGKIWPANPWTRAYRQEQGAPIERTSGWLSGSCQLIRRAAWDSVDGFDTRYFMYFEDVDLGDRIGRAGWHNVYIPSAAVTHIGGKATSRAPKKMLAAHHESAYRYLADRHRGLAWKPVLAAVKAGLKLRLKFETRGK